MVHGWVEPLRLCRLLRLCYTYFVGFGGATAVA